MRAGLRVRTLFASAALLSTITIAFGALLTAASGSRWAVAAGVGGLVGSIALVILFAGHLTRAIVVPVGRLAGAADRLAHRDLSARVPERGSAEVADLARAFNTMAASLEASRDELELQNLELELQAAELEDRRAELERAHVELAEQRELLDEVLTGSADPIFVFDRELRLIYANEGARLLLDRSSSRFLHKRLSELGVARDIVEPFEARLRQVVETGEPYEGDVVSSSPDGDRYFEYVLTPVHGPDGDVTKVVDTVRDLTERMHAEERARRQASINRAVLDATVDAIRLVDLEGNTVVKNKAMERFEQSVLGRPLTGSFYDHPDVVADLTADPEAYRAGIERLAADIELETVDEYQLLDPPRWILRYTAPVRDADGALLGRIFLIRDVTAERQAERLKSELVATVSHELRTPLTGILGFAELLVKHELPSETRQRYLQTIYAEGRRLTDLINEFLDLQRIEAGGFTLALESLDLGELLRHEVELYSAQSASHTVTLTLPQRPLVVTGESDRLAQVTGNLISNAIKYSPEGGAVRVTAEQRGGQARVSVADEGIGIPAAQRDRVFTKFFRSDLANTLRIGGTGLGLALSRELVEAHGGRMGFESEEGSGSTFWFELALGSQEREGTHRRVLVIEDDESASELLSAYLSEDGYAVETERSGELGLQRALEDPPAVICLDIRLPGALDGWQVLERLKTAPATANIPVLVCSAGNGRARAATLGATDFLTKPLSESRLREAIRRLVPERGSVLVVDDEASVRQLVSATLALDGIDVIEAADGEQALEQIGRAQPHALVLDLLMPGVDGFGVLERLQQAPSTKLLPVVVLTARRLSPEERSLLERRAVSVLSKSTYSARELRRLVQRAVGDRRA